MNQDKQVPTVDDFSDAVRLGKVIGTRSKRGHLRQGADAEKMISIDNGALRIQPMVTPGWGRCAIAYGPYKREAGLTLAVFMLNGHNASEGNDIGETLKGRVFRWLRGSETESIGDRLWHWALSSHHNHRLNLFYRWVRNRKGRFKEGHLKENLAIGWFAQSGASDPTAAGNAIVMQSSEAENGTLCVRMSDRLSPAVKSVQNLQTYYIVVLREKGAAYYAASLPNTRGLGTYPFMRLVGVDSQGSDETVYAGIHQGALGQVGFRVDSRVYGARAEVLSELEAWYGTAQVADRLIGNETLEQAEVGGDWEVVEGDFCRTDRGLVGKAQRNLALIDGAAASGGICAIATVQQKALPNKTYTHTNKAAIFWRTQDKNNSWALWLKRNKCQLQICEDGQWLNISTDEKNLLLADADNAIQILDNGNSFSLYLNGVLLFDRWFTDDRLKEATKIGLLSDRASKTENFISFQNLESHPRNIPIPAELKMGAPWQKQGTQILVADNFASNRANSDLNGRLSEIGEQTWRKEIGKGEMRLTNDKSVRVKASAEQPNPGRLAYTVAWKNLEFADISVDILPPGTARHQREKGRGGLIFWQDADHYLIINHWLDDTFDGSAMSAFLHVDGFEEIYDGVWSNLAGRITWGQQHTFRVTFDGLNFTAHVNKEPLLYRSITDIYPQLNRLRINRVGIVANWEWGQDTGTTFSRFIGRK